MDPRPNHRFRVIDSGSGARDARSTMRREIVAGLGAAPRSIPPKYFYDERGSRLFDAICDLPEYYLTRAERALLARHADAIVCDLRAATLVEIGSGMARKTGLLVDAMCRRSDAPLYVPFDIAAAPVEASASALLERFPRLTVCGLVGDFAYDLPRLASAASPSAGPRLFALLGSTIGNLDEDQAPAFVRAIAELMTDGDALLLGVDLVKDGGRLRAAYNDARGVTAAFNKNVLRVVSRGLDGDFDEGAFEHRARYDAALQRIEMHLVARRKHAVTLRDAPLTIELAEGEAILTEMSRKFTRASVEAMLARGGLRLDRWLPDEAGAFALCLARSPGAPPLGDRRAYESACV